MRLLGHTIAGEAGFVPRVGQSGGVQVANTNIYRKALVDLLQDRRYDPMLTTERTPGTNRLESRLVAAHLPRRRNTEARPLASGQNQSTNKI